MHPNKKILKEELGEDPGNYDPDGWGGGGATFID